jgi:phospholipid transport system transporter-binding protein
MLSFKPSDTLTFDTVSSNITRFMHVILGASCTDVVFDVHDVRHCDSAGLALLIEARRLCKTQQCQLSIEGLTKNMLDLATFYHVDALFLKETGDGCKP